MGFIEETGAAQYARDVRVTQIYEGTNGIQAMDLVGRKLADGGDAARSLFAEIRETASACAGGDARMKEVGTLLGEALNACVTATDHLLASDINDRFAGATAYLRMVALTLGAHFIAKGALAEPENEARRVMAQFFATQFAPQVVALGPAAKQGAALLYALDEMQLSA